MRVALSIPDDLFESAEILGKRLGLSRSRLYATALADYLAKHRGRMTSEHLNVVCADQPESIDRALRRALSQYLSVETSGSRAV